MFQELAKNMLDVSRISKKYHCDWRVVGAWNWSNEENAIVTTGLGHYN